MDYGFEGDVELYSSHIEFYLLIARLKLEDFYHGQLKS